MATFAPVDGLKCWMGLSWLAACCILGFQLGCRHFAFFAWSAFGQIAFVWILLAAAGVALAAAGFCCRGVLWQWVVEARHPVLSLPCFLCYRLVGWGFRARCLVVLTGGRFVLHLGPRLASFCIFSASWLNSMLAPVFLLQSQK